MTNSLTQALINQCARIAQCKRILMKVSLTASLLATLSIFSASVFSAAPVLAEKPLGKTSGTVKPNLMLVLDTSKSMQSSLASDALGLVQNDGSLLMNYGQCKAAVKGRGGYPITGLSRTGTTLTVTNNAFITPGYIVYLAVPGNTHFSGVYTILTTNAVAGVAPTCNYNTAIRVNSPYAYNQSGYYAGDPSHDGPIPPSNGCAVTSAAPANSGSTATNFNRGGGKVVDAGGVTATDSGSCYWYDPADDPIHSYCESYTGGSAGSGPTEFTVQVANSGTSGAFTTGAGSQTEDASMVVRDPEDTRCWGGEPPLQAAKVQTLFYNPAVEYIPPPKPKSVGLGIASPGNRLPSMTSDYTSAWSKVPMDGTVLLPSGDPQTPAALGDSARKDFGAWTEMVYCDTADRPTGFASDRAWHESSRCKHNTLTSNTVASSPNYPYPYPGQTDGRTTTPAKTFFYQSNILHQYGVAKRFFDDPVADLYAFGQLYYFAKPFYYNVRPIEYCTAADLKNCTLTSAPVGAYTFPAYVRYCSNLNVAAYAAFNFSYPQCQGAYDASHTYARYGLFERVDVKPAVPSYAKSTDRSDCLAATCTYAEEMTNFANWHAYYRTRMQLTKSSIGRAFDTLNQDYRVGLITVQGYNTAGNYMPIKDFITGTNFQKENWFKSLYSRTPFGGTALRDVLGTVGRIYAGKKPVTGFTAVADDPVQYSCQRNYTLLFTDGYWNGAAGQQIDGSAIGNQDADPTPFPQREGDVAVDTLADVAQYYYETDIRSAANANCTGALGTDVCVNDVAATGDDAKTSQHMTTSTIGLGVTGALNSTDYKTATTGDFIGLKAGTVRWPKPGLEVPDTDAVTDLERATIDDLWHAAVNGHGTYYNATDTQQLITGVSGTLATLADVLGSGSATALSNNTPVAGDNYAFSARYVTGTWTGNLFARTIAGNGTLSTAAVWCVENETSVTPACSPSAATGLAAKVAANADTRTIYANVSGSLQPFKYANLTAAQKVFFDAAAISGLSQYGAYNAYQLSQIGGASLVDYLRGQKGYDRRPTNNAGVDNRLYRQRTAVLGDIVDSDPVYVGKSKAAYADAGYTAFVTTTAARDRVVYVGANDGMLHAFDATTGEERWAYVPTKVMPNMWKLADADYRNNHTNFVNAKMTVSDVYVGGVWKTILVSGFGQGGRGYFALDITDPSVAPTLLWETDDTATWNNLGYSYGYPVIVKRALDDTWVVLITSGYNNTAPGDGKGRLFILDASTGAELVAGGISTAEGSNASPSGLAQISAFVRHPFINNVAQFVYGGDLLGNLWRFDLNTNTVLKFTTLISGAAGLQPITVAPTLGVIDNKRVIFIGTGKYIEPNDLLPATFMQQTLYGIKDNNVTATITGLRATLVEQTLTLAGATRTISSNAVDWGSKNGWFVDLSNSATTGERQNVKAILVSGALIVPTMMPPASECSATAGWSNVFNYRTGSAVDPSVSSVVSQQTLAPIAGMYIVYDYANTTDGGFYKGEDHTDASPCTGSGCGNILPPTNAGFSGNRSIWRELIAP